MGIYANGGITSKVSFVMLAIGWVYFTAMAVKKARERRFRFSPQLYDEKLCIDAFCR